MKETIYRCDDCRSVIREGPMVGVDLFERGGITLYPELRDPNIVKWLFCNLSCFTKYFSQNKWKEEKK